MGLHYLDMSKTNQADLLMAMMVNKKYEGHIKQQIEGAIKACCLQGMMGHLSQCEFEEMVHEKLIQTCTLKPQDVTIA